MLRPESSVLRTLALSEKKAEEENKTMWAFNVNHRPVLKKGLFLKGQTRKMVLDK